MKRLLFTTAVLLLFLVGCGAPPGPEAAAVDTEESEPTAVEAPASTEEEDASEAADSGETEEVDGDTNTQVATADINNLAALQTSATSIQEAAVIREGSDWVKGASDPLLAIVEYGDFQ